MPHTGRPSLSLYAGGLQQIIAIGIPLQLLHIYLVKLSELFLILMTSGVFFVGDGGGGGGGSGDGGEVCISGIKHGDVVFLKVISDS